MFCSKYGKMITSGSYFCIKYGTPINAGEQIPNNGAYREKQAWSFGQIFGLTPLAFLCPLAGWIIGGINVKNPARRKQAIQLILAGVAAFILALMAAA